MWPDHESEIDYVNYSETADLISELVSNSRLRPISIGVFGGWGSGKSTLVKLSKQQLQEDPAYIIVDFDAWLYQDYDDARAALLEAVAKQLIASSQASTSSNIDKAKSLFQRVNKFRAMGLLAEGGALLLGTPAFGLLYKGISSANDIVTGEGEDDDLKNVKSALSEVSELKNSLFSSNDESPTPPQEITAFRSEFSELLQSLDKTLVVYVDNLDRCLPKNAVLTLEAIRLVLFMPNTAFVIAADEDMIRLAVSEHYKTSQNRLVNDYLDKLIQVPVHVPQLGVAEVTSYSFLLLASMHTHSSEDLEVVVEVIQDSLRGLWKDPLVSSEEILAVLEGRRSLSAKEKHEVIEAYNLASRLAPMLSNSRRVAGNPRIIKRLLNTVWMRASIAAKRNMPTIIDKALIAKLAIFERCAPGNATTELYRLINESADGKPSIISNLESKSELVSSDLPESWEDLEFIRDWVNLEPKIADVDLRAVTYLARETLPIRFNVDGLSPEAQKALGDLLTAGKLSSPRLKSAIKSLPADDMLPVLEGLLEQLSKTTDWSRKPAGFAGAIALARKSEGAGVRLKSFILGIGKIPSWMKVQIKDDDWWKRE